MRRHRLSSPRLRTPIARAFATLLIGAIVPLTSPVARANEGTIKRYVMPVATVFGASTPHPSYYVADRGSSSPGFDFRLAPVTFYAKERTGEIMFTPMIDFDLILNKDWSGPKIRGSHGLRTTLFPFFSGSADLLGFHVDLGGSVGFGGPSGFVGGGASIGGKMATIGLAYRRAWGTADAVHTATFDFALTYPFQIGPEE